MTIYLRQSTASQEVPLGYFVDSTDGNTEETALSIANTDIKIWKTGATTLASKNSGGATHISNGIYYCVLDATDTNTIGPLVIFVHVSGALAIKAECVVLDEAVYDVLFGTAAPSTLDAAGVRAAVGLASANLDSQLTAIDDLIDTEIQTIDDFIDTEITDIRNRLPAALVGGRMDASVGAVATGLFTIKKNTALNNFEFLMIDSTDHVTPKTGLTITAQRSIDGGAFAACTNSASAVGNGVYKINLSAADLNGDVITLKFTATGADQTTITILTQA